MQEPSRRWSKLHASSCGFGGRRGRNGDAGLVEGEAETERLDTNVLHGRKIAANRRMTCGVFHVKCMHGGCEAKEGARSD
jgi:hypothetical protein